MACDCHSGHRSADPRWRADRPSWIEGLQSATTSGRRQIIADSLVLIALRTQSRVGAGMNPDKLTQWLKTATGPLLALGTLVGAVAGGAAFLRAPLAKVNLIGPFWAPFLAILLPVGAALLLLLTSYRIIVRKSRLLRPERFDLRVRTRADLFGRDADIDDLQDLVADHRLVFIDGESGSGKSSLVRYGLVPALVDVGELLPILISQYRGDWDVGLSQQTYGILWAALTEAERIRLRAANRPAVGSVNAAGVARLLDGIAEKLGRPVLLIFDQFDDYQLAHRARFLTEQRAWISAQSLLETNAFWKTVNSALDAGHVRMMVVTRSDASAGLHSVRFSEDIASRPILRLAATWLPRLLDELTVDDGKGVVVGEPDNGWEDLKRLIQLDLDAGNGILPQQVRTTLLGLRELPALTPADYRRAGRTAGAEALYIRDSIKWAAQSSGLGERQVRSLLLELVEREGADSAKTRLRCDAQLSRLVPDDGARQKALLRLARDEVVREFDEGGSSGSRWRLDHDYLAAAVLAEERLTNPSAVLLRDKADAWERTSGMGLWQRYRALLPIGTQLRLVWAKLRAWRRFTYQPYRRFAVLSLVKPAPLMLLVVAAAGWALWLQSPSYQIQQIRAKAAYIASNGSGGGLAEWAGALTLSHRTEEALALVRAVKDPDLRASALASIAEALDGLQDRKRASVVAREAATAAIGAKLFESPGFRSHAFSDSIAISEAGGREGGLAVLREARRQLFSPETPVVGRGRVIVRLAQAFRRLDRKDEALSTLQQARNLFGANWRAVLAAAEELHRNGDDEAAVAWASGVTPPSVDDDLDAAMVEFHAARADVFGWVGLRDRQEAEIGAAIAAATAAGSTTWYSGSPLYGSLIRSGHEATLLLLADRIEAGPEKVKIMTSAAEEESRIGRSAEADTFMKKAEYWARRAADPMSRAESLIALAQGYKALANPTRQKSALVDALAALRPVQHDSDDKQRLEMLVEIADELARLSPDEVALGALADASKLSQGMTQDPSEYLPKLAGALAMTGQIEPARMTAEQVRDGSEKLLAFANVLSNYAYYRDPDLKKRVEARAVAASQGD
ncbi:MAG: hypothetical protein QOG84_1376 [Sphingomonadales bacterium]|nr:hypothetical protein [Sphingomonadales bacterium]